MMSFSEATQKYESWLARVVPAPLVRTDLDYKHQLLADQADPFPFFRGTYYRWAQHWAELAGPLAAAHRVLAVGDLHIENFGTWRDADGRLGWGVNDFDEVDELPYTNDLIRLAASIRFARKAGVLDIKFGAGCEAILEGYRECLKAGGRPFVLEEHHPYLRTVAMAADRDPVKFWEKMTKLLADTPANPPAEAQSAIETVFPIGGLRVEYRSRLRVGVGSLGRPRYVALAEWMGGWICREVKAFASPASSWATGVEGPVECKAADAVAGAIRSPDPFYRPGKRWVVRRLGPRSSRIELDHLQASDAGRILHAMGAETANVHLATPGSATPVLTDLASRKAGWLADAAKALSEILEADWKEWQLSWSAGHSAAASKQNEIPGE